MRLAYPHLLGRSGYLPSYFPNKNSLDNNYYYCYETKISDFPVIIICDKISVTSCLITVTLMVLLLNGRLA